MRRNLPFSWLKLTCALLVQVGLWQSSVVTAAEGSAGQSGEPAFTRASETATTFHLKVPECASLVVRAEKPLEPRVQPEARRVSIAAGRVVRPALTLRPIAPDRRLPLHAVVVVKAVELRI